MTDRLETLPPNRSLTTCSRFLIAVALPSDGQRQISRSDYAHRFTFYLRLNMPKSWSGRSAIQLSAHQLTGHEETTRVCTGRFTRPEPDPTTGAIMTPIYATSPTSEVRANMGASIIRARQWTRLASRKMHCRSGERDPRIRIRLRAGGNVHHAELIESGSHVVVSDVFTAHIPAVRQSAATFGESRLCYRSN
jgi:hypothetical protein